MENDQRSKGAIRVELTDDTDGRLAFKLSFPAGLAKYFNTDTYFVRYYTDIGDVEDSIRYIPVIANIAPVAWATGADIRVKELDEEFLGSLKEIKKVMKRMYPDFSCAGDVYVDNVVSNRFGHAGASQLFTGGVDSLATYVRHRDEKPDLISFKTYTQFSVPLQRRIDGELARFAQKEGVRLHMVESNLMFLLNEGRLVADYGRHLPEASWWASVQHGMGLLGLCAPLTVAGDMKNIYIGSTGTQNMILKPWIPWGSHSLIVNNVAWADVRVQNDGASLVRPDKVRLIKQFMEETGIYPSLIVCNDGYRGVRLNCSGCEKCYRTMVGLALEGIDPNRCGFHMDDGTWGEIKKKLLDKRARLIRKQPNMWRDIQHRIPDRITRDIRGSKAFFEWFRTMDILDDRVRGRPFYGIRRILQKLKLERPPATKK